MTERRMLTTEQAADYCGYDSVNGFRANIHVAPVKIGRSVKYDRLALDAFLDRLGTPTPPKRRFSEVAGNEGGARDRG
jgi:hypothetical protein